MLHLTFLGTSAGVPSRRRNVSALALRCSTKVLPNAGWLLIDCGEGTQHQLQRARLSLHELDCICITHMHGDHCYGLPGLLASMGLARRQRPLRLIGPLAVWQWLEATRALTDLYLPFAIDFTDVESLYTQTLTLFAADATQVITSKAGGAILCMSAHPLEHRVPSHAFRFDLLHTQSQLNSAALHATGLPPGPKWRALRHGQNVCHEDRTLRSDDFLESHTRQLAAVIGGDNAKPDALSTACHNAQLLVHEATYSHAVLQKVGPGPMHSSAQQVAQFAQAAGVPNLILTHFSPRHHSDDEQAHLLKEVQAHYHGNAHLARDFACFTLDFDGQLSYEADSAGARYASASAKC